MTEKITLNKGGLFELGMQVIRVINLETDDSEAEYLILLKFRAINITDEILLIGINDVLPGVNVTRTHDGHMVNVVNGFVEDEEAYLESLANRMVEVFKVRVDGWGTQNLHDGQFTDDYHLID